MKLSSDIAAVIVGGASGLGEATVRHLSSLGVRCSIFDMNVDRGEALANSAGAAFFRCDVTDDESVARAFRDAKARHGAARILVNCAGTGLGMKVVGRSRQTGAVEGHPMNAFARIIDINLIGSFRAMLCFSTDLLHTDPIDQDGERGVIVNTASIAAEDGQQGQAAYAASKSGLVGLTLPAARDLAREGVRVMTILPGYFSTPLTGRVPPAAQEKLIDASLFPRRGGDPHEYALLVEHICVNKMLNAECIRLDGGARLPRR